MLPPKDIKSPIILKLPMMLKIRREKRLGYSVAINYHYLVSYLMADRSQKANIKIKFTWKINWIYEKIFSIYEYRIKCWLVEK
ncbi:hypothetical protein [Pseudolactococcus yaeyamensis]